MKKVETPYNLISKYITGNCTPEESESIDSWLNGSVENKKIFNGLYDLWENTGSISKTEEFDYKDALNSINTRIDNLQDKTQKVFIVPNWVKVAAVFIMAVFIGYIVIGKRLSPGQKYMLMSAINQVEEIHLPDGSKVWLNRGGKLGYNKNFGDVERKVNLTGEAFFEVTKNPKKPFIIETQNSVVKVLGTSFNVKVNEQEKETSVFVETGLVQFMIKNNEYREVKLKPGELGIVNNNDISKCINTNPNIMSWKTGILQFKNTSFNRAVTDIEKFYNKKIIIKDTQLAGEKFNGYFEKQPFEVILNVLKLNTNIEVKDSSGIVLISKR